MKKLILLLLFIPLVSLGQVKNGEIKTYYGSGELKSTGNYVNGLEQGEYKFYYESVLEVFDREKNCHGAIRIFLNDFYSSTFCHQYFICF